MDIKETRFQLMFLLCQTLGICNINNIPTIASSFGSIGCIIIFFLCYIFLGIPLIYMELIIGQFTGRDCVDVWKIRPFLSYTGYVLVVWQVIILIYNHIFVSFTVHYFLISFEKPTPYYQCGYWSTRDCNILLYNYTINEDCVRHRRPANYCDDVFTTFPEYQYWRNHVLQVNKEQFNLAWRVFLASGLVCIILYLSCFKRKKSMKWIVGVLPLYPILAFIPVMMGSMVQKGLVVKFEEALDSDFSDFSKKFRLANVIQQVIYNLGIGSGVTFNFASSSSFRSNCFSNGVISVVVSAVFSVIVICTAAMMACPYAYEFNISAGSVMKSQMSFVFEKVPRLLSHYENRIIWLILTFSCFVVIGLCTNILLFYNLLEMVSKRNKKIANYPGLTCLVGTLLMFILTIPFISNVGLIFAFIFRRYVTLVSTFIAMIECIVFVISYGVHKFAEDVHFMLGIQPSFFMKVAWFLASGFLGYAFCCELNVSYRGHSRRKLPIIDLVGWFMLLILCGTIVVSCVVRLLVALCRKRCLRLLRLDSSWGPQSDILQRSRAMFSAQAMTKEYMYRQYHLQAGITSRQKNSNKKDVNECEIEQDSF